MSNRFINENNSVFRPIRVFSLNMGVPRRNVISDRQPLRVNAFRATRGHGVTLLPNRTIRHPPTFQERLQDRRILPLPTSNATIITSRGGLVLWNKRRNFRHVRQSTTNEDGPSTRLYRYVSHLFGIYQRLTLFIRGNNVRIKYSRTSAIRGLARVTSIRVSLTTMAKSTNNTNTLPRITNGKTKNRIMINIPSMMIKRLTRVRPLTRPNNKNMRTKLMTRYLSLFTRDRDALNTINRTRSINATVTYAKDLNVGMSKMVRLTTVRRVSTNLYFLTNLILISNLTRTMSTGARSNITNINRILLGLKILRRHTKTMTTMTCTSSNGLRAYHFRLIPVSTTLMLKGVSTRNNKLLRTKNVGVVRLIISTLSTNSKLVNILIMMVNLTIFNTPTKVLKHFFLVLTRRRFPRPLRRTIFANRTNKISTLFVRHTTIRYIPSLLENRRGNTISVLSLNLNRRVLTILKDNEHFLNCKNNLLHFKRSNNLFEDNRQILNDRHLNLYRRIKRKVLILSLQDVPNRKINKSDPQLRDKLHGKNNTLYQNNNNILHLNHEHNENTNYNLLLEEDTLLQLNTLNLYLTPIALVVRFKRDRSTLDLRNNKLSHRTHELKYRRRNNTHATGNSNYHRRGTHGDLTSTTTNTILT